MGVVSHSAHEIFQIFLWHSIPLGVLIIFCHWQFSGRRPLAEIFGVKVDFGIGTSHVKISKFLFYFENVSIDPR